MKEKTSRLTLASTYAFAFFLAIIGLGRNMNSATLFTSAAPVFDTVKLPAQKFAQATAMWELTHRSEGGGAKIEIHIPSLEIYDPQGRLAFHGDDPDKNADLLRRLPAALKGLTPVVPSQDIKKVYAIVTELGKKADAVAATRKYTLVVTTSATGCKGCKRQDEAMAQLQSKKNLDVNILQVIVQK